ncbi:MAG: hypothetical protein ACFHVJ_08700 [Aestuariibacter sp.]
MQFEMLGNLGDFVGGIAVVITLVYLAYQIRQNTKEVRNNSIRALLDRSAMMFDENIHSPLGEIFEKMDKNETLSIADEWRLDMFVRRNFQLYELVFLKHRDNRISQQVMDAYERRIIVSMDRDYFPTIWQKISQFYTRDFVDYVDSLKTP